MNLNAADYIFKLLVIGYSKSGKSSITKRFLTDKFSSGYNSTIGMDINMKLIHVGDTAIQLTVWDTGSDLAYNSLMPLYYKGSLGAVVTLDVTRKESLAETEMWIREIEKYNSHIPLAIAVNKVDLEEERIISSTDVNVLQEKIQFYWRKPIIMLETSAKTGFNVTELFTHLIEEVLTEAEKEELIY